MKEQELRLLMEQTANDLNKFKNNPGYLIKKFLLLSDADKRDVLFTLNLNLKFSNYELTKVNNSNLVLLEERRRS